MYLLQRLQPSFSKSFSIIVVYQLELLCRTLSPKLVCGVTEVPVGSV